MKSQHRNLETRRTCDWPDNASNFALITLEDATSAAKNIYNGIAVGGTFTESSTDGQNTVINGMSYYGNLQDGLDIKFNQGDKQITSLSDIPLDFSQFEWLAQNIQQGSFASPDYSIFVRTQGGQGSGSNGCYSLFDFIPDGQPNTGRANLVVFNTNDDICITKTSPHDRQFGPTILAPFSQVTVMGDTGFVNGAIIAKSFVTQGVNDRQLHLEGKLYQGPLNCDGRGDPNPDPEPNDPDTPETTPMPVQSPDYNGKKGGGQSQGKKGGTMMSLGKKGGDNVDHGCGSMGKGGKKGQREVGNNNDGTGENKGGKKGGNDDDDCESRGKRGRDGKE
jgi:hypothetical protein